MQFPRTQRCIEIAFQAPTGSNAQGWHFVVLTDAEKRARVAELYRRGFDLLMQRYAGEFPFPLRDSRARQFSRMAESAMHLVAHLHEVPVHVVPCFEGRVQDVESEVGLWRFLPSCPLPGQEVSAPRPGAV